MLNRSAIKDLVYGGLKELAKNTEFYYQSPVSSEYSHLTDAGREAVVLQNFQRSPAIPS